MLMQLCTEEDRSALEDRNNLRRQLLLLLLLQQGRSGPRWPVNLPGKRALCVPSRYRFLYFFTLKSEAGFDVETSEAQSESKSNVSDPPGADFNLEIPSTFPFCCNHT